MKRKYMLFSLLGVLMVQFGFAQQKTITGNITDETGNALPGATILIENTQRGVTSDFDGNYSVEASENEVLIFSYVGYTDKKIKIDTSNNYNVNLNLDNKLDEVVVTSLGIKRDKKSLGFSQQTVKGASITQAKETDISNALRTNQDPRLFKYVEPSRDGSISETNFPNGIDAKYVGAPNGYVNGNVQDYSLPTRTVTGNQRYKSPIYTSAQVKLSLAEAKLKGWSIGSGTVESLLKEGIEESMRFWGVDELDINAYTDAHTSATLADIAYEKWVALYLNGPEAWAEWRRLDMPVLIPSGNAVDPRIPVRDAYDSSIEDNNSANYASIISIQGPDNLHTKLWWDKN